MFFSPSTFSQHEYQVMADETFSVGIQSRLRCQRPTLTPPLQEAIRLLNSLENNASARQSAAQADDSWRRANFRMGAEMLAKLGYPVRQHILARPA